MILFPDFMFYKSINSATLSLTSSLKFTNSSSTPKILRMAHKAQCGLPQVEGSPNKITGIGHFQKSLPTVGCEQSVEQNMPHTVPL